MVDGDGDDVVVAAYGIEQPEGGVDLTIGTVPTTTFEGRACLVCNLFSYPDPDAGVASFATSLESGTGGGPGAYASFDAPAEFVASDEGQVLLDVVASLQPAAP